MITFNFKPPKVPQKANYHSKFLISLTWKVQ